MLTRRLLNVPYENSPLSSYLRRSLRFRPNLLLSEHTKNHIMFRRTTAVLKVNPFALFMRETRRSPKLKGLPVPKRGVMLAKMYRALTALEKTALIKRSEKVTFRRRPKPVGAAKRVTKRPKRRPSKYNKFVAKHFSTVRGAPALRLKKIAALWSARKNA